MIACPNCRSTCSNAQREYEPPPGDSVERIASDAADDYTRYNAWVYERRIRELIAAHDQLAGGSREVADQLAGECAKCHGTGARARTTSGSVMPCSCGVRESSRDAITRECDAVRDMLLAKNAAYGDSALAPLRVFSRASAEEQLLVRIDDKLSRLARGSAAGEDVALDLIGYLILLRVARARTEGDT